ncbi:hypothetical protein ARMGADRAFT_370070 [Armillaria gallica]|uniref:Uncharacterized protein n=1 Tax=Armillaria gallica TaxID=47427 RepID=A0A2H3DYH9_ARMGA|nr:hypothetical protein ARMGADRAFT_370070 [Armillaria gallica]
MHHTGNYQAYPHRSTSGISSNYQDWTDDNEFFQNMTGHQIQTWPQGVVQASSDVRPTQYNSLQQPLHHHSTQPLGHEYVGHYNSLSQGTWLSEQSNFRGRAVYGDPFPPRVEPALSLSHQSWNETSARTQIVPSDPSEAVSLESAVSARP